MSSNLPDVQNRPDHRGIALDRVGLTNVKFPTRILRKNDGVCEVSAKVKLFANLPQEAKGHNLSRFSEVLIEFGETHKVLSSHSMPLLLTRMQERLGSTDVYARFEFDYYIDKEAPVSKKIAPQAYNCAFTGIKKGEDINFILEVNVTAASVCPCSKEMSLSENYLKDKYSGSEGFHSGPMLRFNNPQSSDLECLIEFKQMGMGAHNQRSQIKVEALLNDILWIEDLVPLIEAQASAPTYPILKRPDEKSVTETGYTNPKFSEDIARDVQIVVDSLKEVKAWSIKIENEESIHPFNVLSSSKSDNWNFH